MTKPAFVLGFALLQLALACTRPSIDLKGAKAAPEVDLRVTIEDHSRSLKRLRDLQPSEANTPEARKSALESHRITFEQHFKEAAQARGLALSRESPWRLELTITSLGEVRARYILYGIASGVAWGVGTGLVAHNTRLAIGLGAYELVEESAFWIAGASLFGSYSAPAVVEAALVPSGGGKAAWSETYYVLNGRKKLKALPLEVQRRREVQLTASLDTALDKLFRDLEPLLHLATPPPSPIPAPAHG